MKIGGLDRCVRKEFKNMTLYKNSDKRKRFVNLLDN